MDPCCPNVAINSLTRYLSRNHLFPSSVGQDFPEMRLPSAEEVNADAKQPDGCSSMLSKEDLYPKGEMWKENQNGVSIAKRAL